MGFTDVLKKAFPFISAAASLGGPLGVMAANAVGTALNLSKPPAGTADGIAGAIAVAMADPAQRAAILKAEQDFQVQMQQLGYQHAEELEAIAAKDRDSARNREIQIKDWMPKLLGTGVVSGFIVAVFLILSGHAKADSVLAGTLVGYLSAKSELVLSYYFGSSAGSDRKTELMSQNGK